MQAEAKIKGLMDRETVDAEVAKATLEATAAATAAASAPVAALQAENERLRAALQPQTTLRQEYQQRWGAVQVESSSPIALESAWFQPLSL
jgi:hypothetical protein